jgi:GDP-L-fucose synthase
MNLIPTLDQKIYVAGHRGMVGSAIVRELKRKGYHRILTRTHAELDLTDQVAVRQFFQIEKPDQVYLAAAKVGGIYANNSYPAEFIYDNLMIQNNVIHQAFLCGVRKLLFLGSSCIYPKDAAQPMSEEVLLTGKLEPTNEPYAIAKIAGIKMCESYNRQYRDSHKVDYRSLMPTNLYGPGDNYHPENSHVIPALIGRFHEAKLCNASFVSIWGSGRPRREFLHVDDLACASIFVMNLLSSQYDLLINPMQSHLNVGFGCDVSIRELAKIIAEVVGYHGNIIFDTTKPDGTEKKLLDSSRLRSLGWSPSIELQEGLMKTYLDFKSSLDSSK